MGLKTHFANAPRAPMTLVAFLCAIAPVSFASSSSNAGIGAHWQNYITAEMQRAAGLEVEVAAEARSTEELVLSALQREIRVALKLNDSSSLRLEMRDGSSGSYDYAGLGLLRKGKGLAAGRQFAPTLIQQYGIGELQVGAVFTYENFSSGLGARTSFGGNDQLFSESSSGRAVQIGWQTRVKDGLELDTSIRSAMRMDAFQNYRGLYAEPGRFDVPAEFRAGLNWAVSGDRTVGFSAQRLNYSSVAPFSSRLLPDRFVSLLGDGASPNFQWRDLTVYRLNLDQQIARNSLLSLTVSSSLQPSPTSSVLSNALNESNPDYSLALGLEHAIGRASKLRLGATYAPFAYFLGPSLLSSAVDYSGSQLEAEALFEIRF
jgi:hypothetical protein